MFWIGTTAVLMLFHCSELEKSPYYSYEDFNAIRTCVGRSEEILGQALCTMVSGVSPKQQKFRQFCICWPKSYTSCIDAQVFGSVDVALCAI